MSVSDLTEAFRKAMIEALVPELKDLKVEMNERFIDLKKEMNERFAKVDERFEKMDERFAKMDERFAKLNERLDSIQQQMFGFQQQMLEFKQQMLEFQKTQEKILSKINYEERIVKLESLVEQILRLLVWIVVLVVALSP